MRGFGVETSSAQSDLILIPVPWEATVSYGCGAAQGPDLIRRASSQLDFFNPGLNCAYNRKIYFEPVDSLIQSLNKTAQTWAKAVQKQQEAGRPLNKRERELCEKVNQAGESMQDWLYEKSLKIFEQEKIPALAGGDHSVSEGLLRLIGEKFKGKYGVLHLDAHADLRKSYQGFRQSHASVMRNVLNLPYPPEKLVQAGVRDLCEEEYKTIGENDKIHCFFDANLSACLFSGETWSDICREIVQLLPPDIYVSLDVDVLSWNYAPGTGTPVPGGLSYNQVLHLLSEIKRQKKKLIAFDVVETSGGDSPNSFSEWNGNVSARLIYHLTGLALSTQGRL